MKISCEYKVNIFIVSYYLDYLIEQCWPQIQF